MRPSYCAECNGHLDPYLPDCPHCGAHIEQHDRDAHHDKDIRVQRDAGGRAVEVHRKWKVHVPWGLFLLLGLYSAAAYAYVQYSDQTSPQTIAAQHLAAAEQILGSDNGETAKAESLQRAYAHLIEALTLTPEDSWGQQELEKVTWAMARRGTKPPAELKRRADFIAASWQSIQAGKQSQLPESANERFGFDAIESKAVRLQRYLSLGGVVIFLLWIYREFQDYKFLHKRDDEHELLRRDELHELDVHRRR
ncbi:MAG: hypothetical protein JST54_16285 [Deltaproteobacteria bacterium]|nr:hypothetical protein [Deltaproteobacteria bacterium]